MLRRFGLFLSLFFLAILSNVPAHANLLGDLDNDTRITGSDTLMILKAVIGVQPLTADQSEAADLAPMPGVGPKAGKPCGDGRLTIQDVVGSLLERLAPPPIVDATFANIQQSVFNKSCAFSSCHGSTGHRGNLVLEQGKAYDNLVNVAADIDAGKPNPRLRVAPGNPDGSFILTKLTHPGPDDGDKMPQGTETGLDPAKIQLIKQWIERGAPNDGVYTTPSGSGNEDIPIDPNFDENGDVQLAPPPPGEGVQMVIPAFAVPQGKEIQRNYYFKLPVDHDVDIQRVEFAFNPGSHHLNIFKSDTDDLPDGFFEETFQAVAWEKWYLVVDSQNHSLGWQLPTEVSIHLKAHQQLNLQTHYVNVGDQATKNNRGKVIINWWFSKPGTVKYHLGAMFAQNRKILLPPYQFSSFTKTVTFPQDVHILAMTGHFHSRGKQFFVNKWDGTTVGEEVYRSTAWGDPPFKIFDTPVDIKAGQGLSYECDYYNDTDKPMKFGAHVDFEEHANLFVFFYPGLPDDKAIYDFG
jgi:hypothetical protein